MSAGIVARALSRRTPFFYGWLVLFAVCCAGFARQGPAVATLSIFVEPMTSEFGWSRTAISGAVSLAGVMAAVLSPMLGPLLDRHGARMMLTFAVLVTGLAVASLAFTTSIFYFYVAFCIARTCFAGPFDLGIYGAVNNWFLRHRAIATAISNVAMMAGLVCLPLVAQYSIDQAGWRESWLIVGATVLTIGLLPVWLLVGRRPEDLGLEVDGGPGKVRHDADGQIIVPPSEPQFSRSEALRTPTFWLLNFFTLLVYPIQAGISLHQAPLLIERGIDASTAALVVATFSLFSGISGLIFGIVVRRSGVRPSLLLAAVVLIASVLSMEALSNAGQAFLAAILFGFAIGGIFTILPVAWADFFGRESYGAIRGIALSIQVVAQASGPLISGILRDVTGSYSSGLYLYVGLALAAFIVALFMKRPVQPAPGEPYR
ncbi:MAG: MFS transporter [Hyphomicrobiaceae bacterium]